MNGTNHVNGYLRKRVIVIDEVKFSSLLCQILELSKRYKVVSSFTTMEEALPELKKVKPDILITEVELNGMSGIEGLREIQRYYPSIEVLICTSLYSADTLIEAFASGALGYVIKDESYHNIVDHLDELCAGGSPLSPNAARLLIESYRKNPSSPLSFRETEIVKLLAKGNTYSQIATTLSISKETSKTHLRNIYKKLGVNSKSLALKRVLEERLI